MAKFKVDYHIDEKAFGRSIDIEVENNQSMFSDEVSSAIRRAASLVIYGNFMGQGRYNPRAIGEFTSRRARYYRGWVEQNYGSQRAYLAGAKRREKKTGDSFDYLRNVALIDAVSKHASDKPALGRILSEAQKAKLSNTDPLQSKPGEGYDNLRGYLSSGIGKKLTRKAVKQAEKSERQPVQPKVGTMKYGVQTGKLARAWRDLRVMSSNPRELVMNLNPTMGNSAGTPGALKLTEYLSRNKGWRGLMDHDQLIEALKDQGVIVVNGSHD